MLARQSLTKVCPCLSGRCLAASFSSTKGAVLSETHMRYASTSSASVDRYVTREACPCAVSDIPNSSQSIFSPDTSHWDNIFEDVKASASPLQPTIANLRSLKYNPAGRGQDRAPRSVAMTAGENQAFNEMFTQIFDAHAAADSRFVAGIGQVRSTAGSGLLSKLRPGPKRPRWTSEADEDLDRKKEEMELCETDIQLLEWAMREVFGESERYEEQARLAAATPNDASSPTASAERRHAGALELQPASYPYLLAGLMRTFRDKYNDPHLALAMFDHARNLSVASFVFGCTTPAYNELIETRWRCFRDLRGACDALEEMRVNGVALDNRTRLLAETIRREVGERTIWQEESSVGSGEVWEMLGRLERLSIVVQPKHRKAKEMAKENRRKRRWTSDQETWKAKAAKPEDAEDHWAFDKWELPPAKTQTTERRRVRY
ncbi:hypothetical protein C8Q80DRAFT_1199574 [Daedaleopsis nitida]|nr:hypothetical protein C8Q80DRAFT_1199574 [Daedaleopsis nitida]